MGTQRYFDPAYGGTGGPHEGQQPTIGGMVNTRRGAQWAEGLSVNAAMPSIPPLPLLLLLILRLEQETIANFYQQICFWIRIRMRILL